MACCHLSRAGNVIWCNKHQRIVDVPLPSLAEQVIAEVRQLQSELADTKAKLAVAEERLRATESHYEVNLEDGNE